MSSHPELYVEAFNYDNGTSQIVIACQCGYQEWANNYKFTILNLEQFNKQFTDHWQNDCLKKKGQ